jgi:ABC-2 type transport system permease protein
LSILIATSNADGLFGLLFLVIPKEYLSGLIGMILSFCVSMTTISACTISMEGKNIWLLKSTPVNEKKLFLAKSTLQMIIILPFVLISGAIISLSMDFAVFDWIIVLTIPTMTCVLFAFGGVLINLWLPMLEWEDETKVVKQSMAVLVAMLSGMVVALLPWGIYEFLEELTVLNQFLVFVIINTIAILTVNIVLFTWGVKAFRKLEQ